MATRPERIEIDRTEDGWEKDVEDNFDQIINAPLPLCTDSVSGFLASKYTDCIIMQSGVLWISNGTLWYQYNMQLDYIADLVAGTATLADVVTAYNSLLADAQSKGMMPSS